MGKSKMPQWPPAVGGTPKLVLLGWVSFFENQVTFRSSTRHVYASVQFAWPARPAWFTGSGVGTPLGISPYSGQTLGTLGKMGGGAPSRLPLGTPLGISSN